MGCMGDLHVVCVSQQRREEKPIADCGFPNARCVSKRVMVSNWERVSSAYVEALLDVGDDSWYAECWLRKSLLVRKLSCFLWPEGLLPGRVSFTYMEYAAMSKTIATTQTIPLGA